MSNYETVEFRTAVGDHGAADALPFLLEDYTGIATWAGKPIYDHDQVIGQLDTGWQISGNTITFSFLTTPTTVGLYNNPLFRFDVSAGYTPMSAEEMAVARESIELWDDLIPQTFVEKNGLGADIIFANTTTGPEQARAYLPAGHGFKFYSDVWTADPTENWTNQWLDFNGYGRTTLVHEVGHTLGLNHPGDYDFSDDDNGDGKPDPITYGVDAFYAQDSLQYTIMSYFDPQFTGAQPLDVSVGLVQNAQTPLLHDILAIQAMYGVDLTTRVEDTVYFANSTAGNAVYDLEENPFPYLSVYDAGGIDTFDFSTANSGVFIDLRPGAFSSATQGFETLEEANAATEAFNAVTDEAQGDFALWTADSYADWVELAQAIGEDRVFADTQVEGVTATSHRNISIAYNTIIENAIGGSARDYLVGNHVSNRLEGNGGDDVLNGLGGDDFLIGGSGADEFRFTGTGGDDTIVDFTSGEDSIGLNEIDANLGLAGNQAFDFIGDGAFTNTAGQLRTYEEDGATYIAGDVDGDGLADFTINIGSASVGAGDFFL